VKFFDRNFEIPTPFERYLLLKRRYVSKANEILSECGTSASDNEFSDAWQASDRASIHEGATAWGKWLGRKKLNWIAEQLNDELISHAIFDYDVDRLSREFLSFEAIDHCAECGQSITLLKLLEEHEYSLESERHARVERARNSWTGGTLGGGIKGAIKGAASAEVMNIGGSLICGAFNKIGRHFSRKEWLDESREVFNAFKIELYGAIYEDILANLVGVVACRSKLLNEEICSEWPYLNLDKAAGIFANFRQSKIPTEHATRAAYELIKANPMDAEVYEWLYKHHKAIRQDIRAVSEYFCVPVPCFQISSECQSKIQSNGTQPNESRDSEQSQKENQEQNESLKAFGVIRKSIKEAEVAKNDRREFLNCIVGLIKRHQGEDRDIAVDNTLTGGFLESLRQTFAVHDTEVILAALNTCLFRSFDYGVVFTSIGIRWKNKNASLSKRHSLSWHIFGTADEKLRLRNQSELILARKAVLDLDYAANRSEKWLTIFSEIRTYWQEATFVNPDEELTELD